MSVLRMGARAAWVLVPWLGLSGQAQAVGLNQMSASASENTVQTDTHASGVSLSLPVTAGVRNGDGTARASATVLQLTAAAESRSFQTLHFDASAAQWSAFTYWNTGTQSAYAASDLAGLSLTLNFALQGEVTMPGAPDGGNARSTSYSYSTELYAPGFVGQSGGGTLACGPSGCLGTGAPLQLGTNLIDTRFALTQAITAGSGMVFSSLFVFDGGGTQSALTLSLTGATVSAGSALPLALRFDDGSLYAVTAVPEGQTWMLALAGVGAALLGRRRPQARRRA